MLNDLIGQCRKEGFEYFARMNSDDIVLPDRLEKQLLFGEHHLEVDVVGGAIEEINEEGILRGKTVHFPLTNEECCKYFRFRNPLATSYSYVSSTFL